VAVHSTLWLNGIWARAGGRSLWHARTQQRTRSSWLTFLSAAATSGRMLMNGLTSSRKRTGCRERERALARWQDVLSARARTTHNPCWAITTCPPLLYRRWLGAWLRCREWGWLLLLLKMIAVGMDGDSATRSTHLALLAAGGAKYGHLTKMTQKILRGSAPGRHQESSHHHHPGLRTSASYAESTSHDDPHQTLSTRHASFPYHMPRLCRRRRPGARRRWWIFP
jgi:hypothetical protein